MLLPKEEILLLPREKKIEIANTLDVFLLKMDARHGEDYHNQYTNDPKHFKKLLKKTVAFQRLVYAFFMSQHDRVHRLMNIYKYPNPTVSEYFSDPAWKQENKTFANTLLDGLAEFFDLGVIATALSLNIPHDVSSTSTAPAKYLRKYSQNLATGLNDTTQSRLKQQLLNSIENQEGQGELLDRIKNVFDNENRASVVANTESVRSYSAGAISVAQYGNYVAKQWEIADGACPVCESLDGQIVAIDDTYSSDEIEIFSPPVHPNCRCGETFLTEWDGQSDSTNDSSNIYEDFSYS